jgi:DNA-binding NarL/FixJ family response regulator
VCASSLPVVAVIDRDRLTAYGLALLLHDWGYESVIGASAPELFGRTEALGRPIAAIIADDRAESGSSGPSEAASLAGLAARPIPTVVLVAGTDARTTSEIAACGFAAVPKPVEPDTLRDLLEAMIGRPS